MSRVIGCSVFGFEVIKKSWERRFPCGIIADASHVSKERALRRSATLVLMTLAFALSVPASLAENAESDQATALKGKIAEETTSRASSESGRDRPRKLAMVTPRSKSSDAKQSAKADGLSFGGGWSPQIPETITIKVPRDLSNAADVCIVTAKRVAVHAQRGAGDLYKWWGKFFRQMHSVPVVTPGGAYLSAPPPVASTPSRLYYTHEGRLKTVVAR